MHAGYAGIDKKACEGKGCCWMPYVDYEGVKGGPLLDLPACFYANTDSAHYVMAEKNTTETSIDVSLSHFASIR